MFLLSELFFSSSETTLSSAPKQLPMVVYLLLREIWAIRFQWAPQDQDEDPEKVARRFRQMEGCELNDTPKKNVDEAANWLLQHAGGS